MFFFESQYIFYHYIFVLCMEQPAVIRQECTVADDVPSPAEDCTFPVVVWQWLGDRDCTAQYNCCLPATTDCRRFCRFVCWIYDISKKCHRFNSCYDVKRLERNHVLWEEVNLSLMQKKIMIIWITCVLHDITHLQFNAKKTITSPDWTGRKVYYQSGCG